MKRVVPAVFFLAIFLGGSVPASGDISSLAVYEAQSAAAPLGVISKVPAETDGGVVFVSSHIELGKSIATAAGATLGPLGDAFVTTSVPIPGFTSIPTQVTAQYPPSPVFPTHAASSTNLNAGPIDAVSFTADADSSPNANADAVGGSGGIAGLLHVGGANSHSDSKLMSNGTLVTEASSKLTDIEIGPTAVPLLTIAAMASSASVTIPLGGKPAKSVTVEMSGVQLAGIPIQITQAGVSLLGTLPVPATGLVTVNAALQQLNQLGITLQVVPTVATDTDGGATASGSALEIGYAVPTSLLGSLPTDIGSNETVLLGQVAATATARSRAPLSPPPVETGVTPPASSLLPSGSSAPPVVSPAPTAAPAPVVTAAPPPPPASLFTLPKRTQNAAARRFLLSYRIFIYAAAAAAVVFLLCRKTRLVD